MPHKIPPRQNLRQNPQGQTYPPPQKIQKKTKKQHEPHRKNSLRRYTILPWRNSACEMFANLRIPLFEIL